MSSDQIQAAFEKWIGEDTTDYDLAIDDDGDYEDSNTLDAFAGFEAAWTRLRELRERNDELEHLFNLQWKADRRGTKQWQNAGEGREKTWPDRAKLIVWLLEELDAAKIIIAAARNTELKQYDTPEIDDHGVACLDLALQIKAYDARHKAEEGES